MSTTKRVLYSTAAATVVVAAAGVAQAADVPVMKAPPIQFVRICDMYGANFFQLPGSSICLSLRGQLQSDNSWQPAKDMMVMAVGKTGTYTATGVLKSQQDTWGYEMTAKTRWDARTETSLGTLRAFAELKIQLDAGLFNGIVPGPGVGETGAGNKSELYRAYLQWAGWTIGESDSIFALGSFKDGDVLNVLTSEKSSAWTVFYTWTPNGPGQPPKKGYGQLPDGWSFSVGADSPLKHISKPQAGGGTYQDLVLGAGSSAGLGSVAAGTGTLRVPDVVARLHFEGDPTGKDPQFNDQWGIGTIHVAGAWHQIRTIATGESGKGVGPFGPYVSLFPVSVPVCGGTCPLGTTFNSTGYAFAADVKIYTPMWGNAKLGSAKDPDNLWFNVVGAKGALEYGGIGGTNGNLGVGDAYWTGGFQRDDTDGKLINRGNGTYYIDKEKSLAVNAQYHHIMTDCTDPVNCLALNLEFNYAWVTPGSITQNVDWTNGGLGKAKKMALTANIIWGVNRYGTTKPTSWEAGFEVQWLKVWQDLPCNNNGNVGIACPAGAGNAPTALPTGIKKDPSNWVARATISKDF